MAKLLYVFAAMKTTTDNYNTINDAYQLVEGAKIRAKKNPEEIFVLSHYDADKRGYVLCPYDDGTQFNDFEVVVSENELIFDYEIQAVNVRIDAA